MKIRNDCPKPPSGLLWQLRRSLSWIGPPDLDGIDFIWLIPEISEASLGKNQKLKQLKEEGISVYGFYHAGDARTPTYITLNVKDVYRPLPPLYWWGPATTLWITRTLAHEVAHHLVIKRGYIFEPGEKFKHPENEEEFAERYGFHVLQRMQQHWYYKLGARRLKKLAFNHYSQGIHNWNSKRFALAAEHWYNSLELDPDLKEAWYWYGRAKKAAAAQE